jgi:hypothetical protein
LGERIVNVFLPLDPRAQRVIGQWRRGNAFFREKAQFKIMEWLREKREEMKHESLTSNVHGLPWGSGVDGKKAISLILAISFYYLQA